MEELQIFNYREKAIRTTQIGGEPWFVLKDVCDVLGLTDTNKISTRIDPDELTRIKFVSGGQTREMLCVNESGLYNVILRSDKQEAKPFRKWVTSEVLPSIRKHGAYMTPETLQAAILNPDYLLQVVTALKNETDKRKALEITNASLAVDLEIARPKAEYFDELAARNTLTNFRETAKELGVGPKKFTEFLLRHKYIYRDDRGKLMPYERKNTGYFEVKECFNEKTQWSGTQTLITPKGREAFRMMRIDAE